MLVFMVIPFICDWPMFDGRLLSVCTVRAASGSMGTRKLIETAVGWCCTQKRALIVVRCSLGERAHGGAAGEGGSIDHDVRAVEHDGARRRMHRDVDLTLPLKVSAAAFGLTSMR